MLTRSALLLGLMLSYSVTPVFAQNGFPEDFPKLVDQGGFGKGEPLTGFGGDETKSKNQNRAALVKRPVILIHGNGATATHEKWGLQFLRNSLYKSGYNKSEVWSVSYLGQKPSRAELPEPHRTNINDIRLFIDSVREYLGVEKIDIVSHSLGSGMAKAYMLGYGDDGKFHTDLEGIQNVGSFVSLAAGFYGLGPFSTGEFQSGSTFERSTHVFQGVTDDTPMGSADEQTQIGNYRNVTELDNGTITYAAIWATNDFVDMQNPNTGRMVGAELNKGFFLGWGLPGHEAIIKNEEVFSTFLPYLNRGGSQD